MITQHGVVYESETHPHDLINIFTLELNELECPYCKTIFDFDPPPPYWVGWHHMFYSDDSIYSITCPRCKEEMPLIDFIDKFERKRC